MANIRREYKNYDDYLRHQASKLDKMLKKKNKSSQKVRPECFNKRVGKFIGILEKYVPHFIKSGRVLCLGARNGAEVKAFRELGFSNSIGIDLNPGKNNKYVIKGDFHNTEFEDNSFKNIFTNSLDHIFDIEKLSKEIHRILVPSGILVLEIAFFLDIEEKDKKFIVSQKGAYESFCFNGFEDIEAGFKEMRIIEKYSIPSERLAVVLENIKDI